MGLEIRDLGFDVVLTAIREEKQEEPLKISLVRRLPIEQVFPSQKFLM